MDPDNGEKPVVFTIGHSNRTMEEFIEILKRNGITWVVDVRTVPQSRKNPQFNREDFPGPLRAAGIGYIHMPRLGGLRHPQADSINCAWQNESFRGFADYMQTPEFEYNINKVLDLSSRERVVLMCAEVVPWRCHRSLIADALVVRGVRVEEIIGKASHRPHTLTPWARVDGTRVTYPVPEVECSPQQ